MEAIKPMPKVVYNTIKNRYEFIILFDVEYGNPNGDPDADNMPRIDPETNIGIVTDACIKRKIRNRIELDHSGDDGYDFAGEYDPENEKYDIYINRNGTLNSKDEAALKALKENKVDKADEERFVLDYMCGRYFDVRTFGAVMTSFTKNETKLSGNAGQLKGPVQITFSHSIDEVYPQNITITRVAITSEKDADKKNEMGNKWIIPYGLYRCEGFISANSAQKTGFSEKDLEELWNAILMMFEEDRSAARGKMVVRKLIIFKHNSKHGNAPAHKLLESVVVEKKDGVDSPRHFSDYNVIIPTNEELPDGVTIEVRD